MRSSRARRPSELTWTRWHFIQPAWPKANPRKKSKKRTQFLSNWPAEHAKASGSQSRAPTFHWHQSGCEDWPIFSRRKESSKNIRMWPWFCTRSRGDTRWDLFTRARWALFVHGIIFGNCGLFNRCVGTLLDGKSSALYRGVHTLLINQDNGPENNSKRTQFMQRLIMFVDSYGLNVRLAYYPPYHSKYNPVEPTFWSIGELLEWLLAWFFRSRFRICAVYAMEWRTSDSRMGNEDLQDGSSLDSQGDGSSRTSVRADGRIGKMVCDDTNVATTCIN